MLLPNYIIEDIKNNLYTSREEHKCYLAAWKAVTRNRKKDGTDYQNTNKNFNGTQIVHKYSTQWLVIYTQNGSHYIEDSVLVDHCETIDEMFKAIAERIDELEKEIEEETTDLANFDKIITDTCSELETALDHFLQSRKSKHLQYALPESIAKYITFYCID